MRPAALAGPAVVAAGLVLAAAPAAGAGTGEPPASLNAVTVTAKGAIAVGADSISPFVQPLCGTDMSDQRGASRWTAPKTPSPSCGWLDSVAALPGNKGGWKIVPSSN